MNRDLEEMNAMRTVVAAVAEVVLWLWWQLRLRH